MHESDIPAANPLAPRLGIIGGGQLARMTAFAAHRLGCDVVVLEKNRHSPAAAAAEMIVGDWSKAGPLFDLASLVDVVTLENEFVDSELLAQLEARGHTVFPSSRTLACVQDKFAQKKQLHDAGLPTPPSLAVPDRAALDSVIAELGLPLVLKARRNAYDGRGNATIRSMDDADAAWTKLGGDQGNPLYAEAFCEFSAELAVIVTRGRDGECVIYPVVETVQRDHVCHLVRAPAPLPAEVTRMAEQVARRAVDAVEAVGSFGVEMFLTRDGRVLVNELAPRVHNSGHYTIEACACSQFENHVRAVLGLPLGSPRMLAPAAAMVNLLGTAPGGGKPAGLEAALAVPGASVHLYGKPTSGKGRKMGHVTAVADTLEAAEQTALEAAGHLHFPHS